MLIDRQKGGVAAPRFREQPGAIARGYIDRDCFVGECYDAMTFSQRKNRYYIYLPRNGQTEPIYSEHLKDVLVGTQLAASYVDAHMQDIVIDLSGLRR